MVLLQDSIQLFVCYLFANVPFTLCMYRDFCTPQQPVFILFPRVARTLLRAVSFLSGTDETKEKSLYSNAFRVIVTL